MRKLPPDSEVFALKACGMEPKDIAERFGVGISNVYSAIRRWEGKPTIHDRLKSPNEDTTFVRKNAQPVEHRDTGENVGANQPVDTYRVRHTTLRDCGDLLREWGVGRSFA